MFNDIMFALKDYFEFVMREVNKRELYEWFLFIFPFFVFLNYYDVHAPYIPPQPFRGQFSELEEPGGRISTDWGMDHIYMPMTPEQLQEEIDAYDGAIAYVDYHIAKLLAELETRGLVQNTLVVILSDHGESFGEHGLLEHHNSLYREVIHVPMIFWWPDHVPAGERVTVSVSIAAIPATVLDIIGDAEQASLEPLDVSNKGNVC